MLCSSISRRSPVRLIQITIITHSTTTQITVRVRANISISPRNSLIADSPVTSKDSSWGVSAGSEPLFPIHGQPSPYRIREGLPTLRQLRNTRAFLGTNSHNLLERR